MNKEGAAERLLEDLEFLQCLANPDYIVFLIRHNYFRDEVNAKLNVL